MKGFFICVEPRTYGEGRDAREVNHVLFLDEKKKKGDFPITENVLDKFNKMEPMTPFELKFGMVPVNQERNAWKPGILDVVTGRPAAA